MEISRRALIANGALIGIAASAGAAPSPERPMLLLDPALSPGERRAAGMTSRAVRLIAPDLVRQWRDGLEREVAQAGGAIAFVRWDKCLLLAGLAREAGLRSSRRRLGRSLFQVSVTGA